MKTFNYGSAVELETEFDQAVEKTIAALQEQGFGVLSDIDVRDTLKKKLDIDFRQYRILGACNPKLAFQALSEEENLGLLLPCNVIVYELNNHRVRVVAVDPVRNLGIVGNDALTPVAREVKLRLISVLESIEAVASTPA